MSEIKNFLMSSTIRVQIAIFIIATFNLPEEISQGDVEKIVTFGLVMLLSAAGAVYRYVANHRLYFFKRP